MIRNIPDGWNIEKLGEAFIVKDGTHDSPKYVIDDITYPLLTSKNIKNGKLALTDCNYISKEDFDKINKRSQVHKNDIIMPMIGTIGNPLLIINEPNFAIKNVALFKPKNENSKFLLYYLKSNFIKQKFLFDSKGGTQKFVSLTYLRNLPIPLPSLPQQEKIVKVLDISSHLIEKQKELIEEYNLFLKSKFIEMFGDPIKNPMRWEVEKLVNLIEQYKGAMRTGPFGSSLKKEFYVKDGYKIYGQEQVIKNNFNYGNYYIDDERYKTLKGYSIKEKDILISLVGTFGKIAIVPKLFEAGIINPRLMKISLDTTLYNPVFFKDLFYTEGFKAQLLNFSHGGTMGILNLTILKELKYIKPPIELQNKFASIVEKIETIKKQETQKLEHLKTLHNSLMDKAFKGEIK